MGTFIELLIGAMLTPAGFVTEAYLVVTMRNHWSSYYLEFRVSEEKIDALKTLMEPDLRNLGIETFPIQLGNEEWITLNGLALRVALTNAGG